MTWSDEFDEGYAVPAEISGLPDLEDDSWHNNTCPTFHNTATNRTLWVEHPLSSEREGWEHRYTVTKGGYVEADAQVVYEGDYLPAALVNLNAEGEVCEYLVEVSCTVLVVNGEVTRVTFMPSYGESRVNEGSDYGDNDTKANRGTVEEILYWKSADRPARRRALGGLNHGPHHRAGHRLGYRRGHYRVVCLGRLGSVRTTYRGGKAPPGGEAG